MILVDTNVISELMRSEPSSLVLSWFGTQDPSALFLSAITEAELRTGVGILPAGQRRERLLAAIDAVIDEDFADRVLPFDSEAAKSYAGGRLRMRTVRSRRLRLRRVRLSRRATSRILTGAACR
jgi:toxin FitB